MMSIKTKHRKTSWMLAGLMLLSGGATFAGEGGSNVAMTKHNLTSSGPGTVKVADGRNVCSFCHTPHAASPDAPLWNRRDPGTYYQTYESSTLKAEVGQPTGSSRLCLSCHDGTIALSDTYNSRNAAGGSVYLTSGNRGYIGTDLRDDHPISFIYDGQLATTNGELRHPGTLPASLPLDANGQLQCTTCHDVHDDRFGKFKRMDNNESAMCVACHNIEGWTTSPHATATANLSNAAWDTWDNLSAQTVRGAGCESCHRPHSAGQRERLLRHEAEENNCLNCHSGDVAQKDIAADLQRISAHPASQTTGVHDPTENPATMTAHVECADCHDPHQSSPTGTASAPDIKPVMQGASGLTRTGQMIATARYEYEVCYKCHSERNFARQAVVERVLGSNDISDEFDSTNASFHPVETQGRNGDVPSLKTQWQTTSMVYCTDCHGSDAAGSANGPHGSNQRPLLKARYTTLDNSVESPQAYAMCYQCHERTSILENDSFRLHKKHIVDERTPCSVCHDPHGVKDNTNLINFDRDVVGPFGTTGPSYTDLGNGQATCILRCHGENHDGSEDD